MTTPFDDDPPRPPGIFARLRASFFTGIVVVVPAGVTLWLVWTAAGWFDSIVLPLIPSTLQPKNFIGVNLRGIGIIVFLISTIFVGWLAKGLLGRSLIRVTEGIVSRTPVVRTIYSGIKQISETIFVQTERSFEKAVLVEYPRHGIWAIGFISTYAKGEIARSHKEDQLLSVFVPTTPNPTSGFLLYFPASDVIELDMTVEEAAKLVISAGLVYPPNTKGNESDSQS